MRRCFFQIRKTNYNYSFPILPPLARCSNSVSIITSSYISPCLLVWCFFFLSFHLLITLCTQLTQIKEQLQSRSRKLELKGFSPLSTSPSLLISRHFSSNSSGEPSAERGNVCLSQAVPSSPFLSLYLAKTVLSRVPGPGITEKPLGSKSAERTVPKSKTNKIRTTKQVGI